MLIPISTDAPIYHFPFATIGLIVANLACFAIAGHDNDAWLLHYGEWNPLEWLSSIFAHLGIVHLVGNMFFLWSFGLIVEGKLGWYRFLLVYLFIGVSQSAVEQSLMLVRSDDKALLQQLDVETQEQLFEALQEEHPDLSDAEAESLGKAAIRHHRGGSCGASSAIFGLLAICLVWAPKNEFHVIMFIAMRAFSFDVTIMWYSLWYFGWEIFFFLITGGQMNTPALHLMGAVIGFGVGVLFLKKDWVDCENWDLFRVLSGKYGRFADPSTTVGSHADPRFFFGRSSEEIKAVIPENQDRDAARGSREFREINQLIDDRDYLTAGEKLMELRLRDSRSRLNESRLRALALGLLKADGFADAEMLLEEYLERFPESSAWARLRLAQLQLVHFKRPRQAIRTLKPVRREDLTPEQVSVAKKIAAKARQQIDAGIQDAESEW